MAATPSGKDKTERWMRLYVGGYNLSGDARTVGTLENGVAEVDVSGWSEAVRNYLSGGVWMSGIRGLQVLMNDTTGQAYARLKNAGTQEAVSILFGGGGEPAIPDPAYLIPAIHMNSVAGLDNSAGVLTGDFDVDAGTKGTGTQKPFGVVLHPQTSLNTATNGASHDNGAATAAGWSANVHVVAAAGGACVLRLQHSTDDSAWSTLATFTANGQSVTSEHISATGTVNRYVRFSLVSIAAGSVTPVVTFARN